MHCRVHALRLLWLLLAGTALADEIQTRPTFEWHLPEQLPMPNVPDDNPMSAAKVELGCRLFFELRLSRDNQHACATCHEPARAFTDGQHHSRGIDSAETRRNSMSLINVAYNASYTWADASIKTLEQQMRAPLFGTQPLEMGMDPAAFPTSIANDSSYQRQFASAFPAANFAISWENAIKAIASFERSLIAARSKFDRYVFFDERTALSASAKRGMELFFSSRSECSSCHAGINFDGVLKSEVSANRKLQNVFANNGATRADASDQGLFEATGEKKDLGRFRVPSLRNVELTAPYMHDGSISTLEAVVSHYNSGVHKNPLSDKRIRSLGLRSEEQADLVAFLKTLTDAGIFPQQANRCAAEAR